jgi:hypothetical protein
MKILFEDAVDITQILMWKKTHSEHLFQGLKAIFLNLLIAKWIELMHLIRKFYLKTM